MDTVLWLIAGFLASLVLIFLVKDSSQEIQHRIFGYSLIIAALIYVCFAALDANVSWLIIESAGVVIYSCFFILSNKRGLYWLAAGWMLHPVWDAALHLLDAGGSFAPNWYAIMCISFDITVAGYLLQQVRVERQTS